MVVVVVVVPLVAVVALVVALPVVMLPVVPLVAVPLVAVPLVLVPFVAVVVAGGVEGEAGGAGAGWMQEAAVVRAVEKAVAPEPTLYVRV